MPTLDFVWGGLYRRKAEGYDTHNIQQCYILHEDPH